MPHEQTHGSVGRALGTLILRGANSKWMVPLDGVLSGMAPTVHDLAKRGYNPLAAKDLLKNGR
eukprot:6893182-Lingulodinium_polyedra.AAC.1